jgi:methionine-gamma-lyase
MSPYQPQQGISSLVNHLGEQNNSLYAHVTPIYETSAFYFPDVATGADMFAHKQPGYIYSRLDNPNHRQLAEKIAALEALELLRAHPDVLPTHLVRGRLFASGMAAVTAAILARAQAGQTIIAQESIYGASYSFLNKLAPRYGLNVVWLRQPAPQAWEDAFQNNPTAVLAYAESPANPAMQVVDLAAVADIAHHYGAWLAVDNTFATPWCQRPLALGADLVIHSTTKYISGHGHTVGGALVSQHLDFMDTDLRTVLEILGAAPSPFDTWLTNIGLKTFALRMQRHCDNAMQVAQFLEAHPAVAAVHYPGLESHPQHAIACRQMLTFGGMLSFELKGGLQAGETMMNRVRLCTLAVSLGNVDSLIQHPASMSQSTVPVEMRHQMGVSDGLVRFSVGIEEVEDIIADLAQAMSAGD